MANCEITGKIGYWAPDGTFTGSVGVLLYAVPDINSRRYLDGLGVYRPLGVNPNIQGNEAFRLGRVIVTVAGGAYTFQLPYGATATHPTTPSPRWTIALPDGKFLTGIVPDDPGPFELDDLATANGTGVAAWVWANEVYVAPVTPGTLTRGVVPFTAASTYSVVFTTPFVSTAYNIRLTTSADTVTGQIPGVAYSSKTTTGFTINLSDDFTGSVDWEAVL